MHDIGWELDTCNFFITADLEYINILELLVYQDTNICRQSISDMLRSIDICIKLYVSTNHNMCTVLCLYDTLDLPSYSDTIPSIWQSIHHLSPQIANTIDKDTSSATYFIRCYLIVINSDR